MNQAPIIETQGEYKQYDPASRGSHDPKFSLDPEKKSKTLFAVKILVLVAVVGFGIYYFYIKGSVQAPTVDPNLDTDSDGLPDRIESAIGTSPSNPDSDEDTYTDVIEIKNGYNPLNSGSGRKYSEEEWIQIQAKILETDINFYEKLFKQPEKKPGWIKYQSDDHWFEIYYPNDWVINYPPDSVNYVFMEFKRPETNDEKVSLTYFKDDNAFKAEYGVSLEAYYGKVPSVEKREMVTFGANQFQKVIVRDCPVAGSTCTKYFYIYNGHIYQFEYEVESETIEEIISTFAIIE